jgi:hypothetical protein
MLLWQKRSLEIKKLSIFEVQIPQLMGKVCALGVLNVFQTEILRGLCAVDDMAV